MAFLITKPNTTIYEIGLSSTSISSEIPYVQIATFDNGFDTHFDFPVKQLILFINSDHLNGYLEQNLTIEKEWKNKLHSIHIACHEIHDFETKLSPFFSQLKKIATTMHIYFQIREAARSGVDKERIEYEKQKIHFHFLFNNEKDPFDIEVRKEIKNSDN